ncbi:MAG: HPr family phosphocarrier protein, partial [Leptotrichiaceae bacterium]|nr:HPr family phosphocarrier protein [Leptotrichiaceae bacterium]
LSIGIKNGSEITVYAEGADADKAVEVLGDLLANIRD